MASHYENITTRILAQLENGVTPWDKPWKSNGSVKGARFPYNFTTGKAYNGINIVMLLSAGYASPAFATFKQIQAAGGSVKKGETATPIYFMSRVEKKAAKASEIAEGESDGKFIWLMRCYFAFNVAQCDGIALDNVSQPEVVESVIPSDTAELIDMLSVDVRIGSEAFYVPSRDYIEMPSVASFLAVDSVNGSDTWTGVFLHELGHWTGAEKRLNRTYGKRFGDSEYAFEELVAELTSAFLCAELGIDTVSRSANYLASWIRVIKSDSRAFYKACTLAQKACEYIRQQVTENACQRPAIAA